MSCRRGHCRLSRRSALYPARLADNQYIPKGDTRPVKQGERDEARRLEEGFRILEGEGVYADEDPAE